MMKSRGIYEAVHGVLFLVFIGGCYLFVFAGIITLMWVVFSVLVRAAL